MNNTKIFDIGKIVASICEAHNKNGGSTTDILSGVPILKGFAVDIVNNEVQFSGKELTPFDLMNYLEFHIFTMLRGRYYLGTWYDQTNDKSVIDCIAILDNKDEAIAFGKAQAQTSIYDLLEQVTIELDHAN